VGYREQVREQLSGAQVPTIVPNAEELQPLLVSTKYGSKTYSNSSGGNGSDGDFDHVKVKINTTNVGKGLGR
jgi:hypothetical protein